MHPNAQNASLCPIPNTGYANATKEIRDDELLSTVMKPNQALWKAIQEQSMQAKKIDKNEGIHVPTTQGSNDKARQSTAH